VTRVTAECEALRITVDVALNGSHSVESHRCALRWPHVDPHVCLDCPQVWSSTDFDTRRVSGLKQAAQVASDP